MERGSAAIGVGILAAVLATFVAATSASAATFEPGPCPSTTERIEQALRENNARCGSLVVPENRRRGTAKTIRLAVAIVPAKSATPAPDPIVFLSGGPGITTWTQIAGTARVGFNRERDVIFMAQRGTRFNSPQLTCPEIERYKVRSVALRSYAKSTRDLFIAATSKCRQRLAGRGIDLSGYNTTESAADFAELRVALGLARWNVFGGSYGTDLALAYVRNHPLGIRSVAIDSIVPPNVAGLAWTWTNTQEGIENLFRACRAQRACNRRYPRLGVTFNALVRKLEADPVTTPVKTEDGDRVSVLLDGAALLTWITDATTSEPARVPALIDAVARGRPEEVAEAHEAAAHDDVAYGMSNSVLCSEWVPFERKAKVLAQGRRSFPGFPDSVLAEAPGLSFLTEGCGVWNVRKAPESARSFPRSKLPALVLGGTFDALTGARWARYAAGRLRNATLAVVPGVGHGGLFKGGTCPQAIFAAFLSNPNARPDASCLDKIKVPPFEVAR